MGKTFSCKLFLLAIIIAGSTFSIGYITGWSKGTDRNGLMVQTQHSLPDSTALEMKDVVYQNVLPTLSSNKKASSIDSSSSIINNGQQEPVDSIVTVEAHSNINGNNNKDSAEALINGSKVMSGDKSTLASTSSSSNTPEIASAQSPSQTGLPVTTQTTSFPRRSTQPQRVVPQSVIPMRYEDKGRLQSHPPQNPSPGIPETTGGQPSIVFESIEYDFGTVLEGETIQHDFIFANYGTQPLLIRRVTSGCGCTAVLSSSDTVLPKEHGQVRVSLNTQGYKGVIKKHIYVETNDPGRPRIVLELKGTIERDIEASPSYVYIPALSVGEQANHTLSITSHKGTDFRITKIGTTSQSIHATIKQVNAKSYQLSLAIGPLDQQGRISGSVVLETDHPKQSRLLIRVFANVTRTGERTK